VVIGLGLAIPLICISRVRVEWWLVSHSTELAPHYLAVNFDTRPPTILPRFRPSTHVIGTRLQIIDEHKMARISQGSATLSSSGARATDPLTDLTRLLNRLQQTVLRADAERERRLRASEYERKRVETVRYLSNPLAHLQKLQPAN